MHIITRFIAGIAVFTVLVFFYILNFISARDPTSVFFDPRKGYAPQYSTIRRQQAEDYISSYSPANGIKAGDASQRKLCVGIPSFKRESEQYLSAAVGSLLEGLTAEERTEIYLMVFLPHSKPAVHPAYTEEWLSGLTDEIVTYGFGMDRTQYIANMEQRRKFDEKALFDYAFLLDKCAEQLTPYVAIFEDDTLAMDGWYHRTMAAVREAEQQAALQRAKPDFLYLRLFYTEKFLGWNAEDWKQYLFNSIYIAAFPTFIIFALRYVRPTTRFSRTLQAPRTLLILYSTLALSILLYFGLGRLTVSPMPSGVHEMPRFGCCSQAFVFPNNKALELVTYLKDRHLGSSDVLIEDFANERGELRYAITPSLVQHIGKRSSKGDDYGPMSKWGMSVAEQLWSFAFERFDPNSLRLEHEEAIRLRSQVAHTPSGT